MSKKEDMIKRLEKLKDLEWELSDEQGYWGGSSLQKEKENEELKETLKCTQDSWFNDTQKLDKLQKELDKKDKVIGLMANQLSIASDRYEYMEETEIIEYFYKKVGGEDE